MECAAGGGKRPRAKIASGENRDRGRVIDSSVGRLDAPAMSGTIETSRAGRVLLVTFHRPEKKNAFTVDMYRGLVAALAAASADDDARVVLLRGAGGAFTSGNDLGDFMQAPPQTPDHPVLQFLRALARFEKPIVAAVEGPAVGIGTTLLLHCDLVFASEDAKLRMPFVPLGLVPEGASSVVLPRMVGPQVAAELLLLGDAFGAERARSLGLVNEVHASGEALHARALERATELARRPPAAVRASKALLRQTTVEEVVAAIDREAAIFAERLQSPEAMEAMSAFMEKREPNFDRF
jgi:enoyl-CoA hydratase/carnithine racemase